MMIRPASEEDTVMLVKEHEKWGYKCIELTADEHERVHAYAIEDTVDIIFHHNRGFDKARYMCLKPGGYGYVERSGEKVDETGCKHVWYEEVKYTYDGNKIESKILEKRYLMRCIDLEKVLNALH